MLRSTAGVATDGTEGNADSGGGALSADGRYVAFASRAWNLVPGDTPLNSDVFVRDRLTRRTELVSVPIKWTIGAHTGPPSISADGRFVAFSARHYNLVPRDWNFVEDVFVRDRLLLNTAMMSVSTSGRPGNERSLAPVLSADGGFVVFDSGASNLVPGDENGGWDVFLHERGDSEPGTMLYDVSSWNLAYGEQPLGTTRSRSFSVRSTGTAPLRQLEITLRGPDAGQFRLGGDCGATLAVDASCTVRVTFAPTTVGAKAAEVRVSAWNSWVRTPNLSGVAVRP